MAKQETVVRFDDVSFKYGDKKVVLDEASFLVRKNSKLTIMGQNGAGKSTMFKLITGKLQPQEGQIHIQRGAKIGIAEQMVPEEKLDLTVLEYFESAFDEEVYGIEGDVSKVMYTVNLDVDTSKKVRELSGGQKARLLLAAALIDEPDILLLDEPTNNLDQAGIDHLTTFLIMYEKTCLVISHDTEFLSTFTDGIINLDVATHKTEQFVGDYYSAVEQIERQIERQRLERSRIEKSVKDRFQKVNKLGGKSVAMRRLAKKVREDIRQDRESMTEMRQDDKVLPGFEIPVQHTKSLVMKIDGVSMMHNHKVVEKKVDMELHRGKRMIISGPNGIGKSTLLGSLMRQEGATIDPDVRVGYYSQDFTELDFEQTAFESMREAMAQAHPTSGNDAQKIYNTAGRFLIPGGLLQNKVGSLSEGQKGLLCYARFMLQEPGLLIMDEPTNHINFRHIPVIAEALKQYKGALIVVSHLPEFVKQLHINMELNLDKLVKKKK